MLYNLIHSIDIDKSNLMNEHERIRKNGQGDQCE